MSQLHLLSPASALPMPTDGARIALDRYYSPPRLAQAGLYACQRLLGEPISGLVLEGHAGAGAWARGVLDYTEADVVVGDIDRTAPAMFTPMWNQRRRLGDRVPTCSYEARDFLTINNLRPHWVIGNPPFVGALEHVEHALSIAPRVLFVLLLSFLESQARMRFHRRNTLRHVWVCAQRPSFVAGGATDQRAIGLFFFDRDHDGPPTLTPCWDWHAESLIPFVKSNTGLSTPNLTTGDT